MCRTLFIYQKSLQTTWSMQTVEVIRSIGIVLLYICTILLVELQYSARIYLTKHERLHLAYFYPAHTENS